MEFTPDQKDKIKHFNWTEDEQEGTEAQPGIAIAEDVVECAKSIASYVLETLDTSHYDSGRFVISIPLGTHRLLQERYNPVWTDDSRAKIFELVRGVFSATVDADKDVLTDRINQIAMPSSAGSAALNMLKSHAKEHDLDQSRIGEAPGQYRVKWAKLYDEPTVMVGDMNSSTATHTQIVAEIEVDNFQEFETPIGTRLL
jgi:hypothetical protein